MEKNRHKERHEAIQTIIGARKVTDQQSLLELLSKEYNIKTSQAVLSRDLRSLGIVKKAVDGGLMYDTLNDPSKDILRKVILEIAHNEVLIVINTVPGCAALVGDYIDAHKNIGILGTLAGENVVFVTPVSIRNIQGVYEQLKDLMHRL